MRGSLGSSVYHSHGDGSDYIVEEMVNSGYHSPRNGKLLNVMPQKVFKSPMTDFGD
jgi:hypothetical protein